MTVLTLLRENRREQKEGMIWRTSGLSVRGYAAPFSRAVRGARRAANGELPGFARPTDWKKSRRAGKDKRETRREPVVGPVTVTRCLGRADAARHLAPAPVNSPLAACAVKGR